MELKKNPKADLNLQRTLFFQIGLCVALAGTLYAFNWREGDGEAASLGTLQMEDLTEMEIPQTEQKVDKVVAAAVVDSAVVALATT